MKGMGNILSNLIKRTAFEEKNEPKREKLAEKKNPKMEKMEKVHQKSKKVV